MKYEVPMVFVIGRILSRQQGRRYIRPYVMQYQLLMHHRNT